eukprot:143681-Pelagomonas_calceolata.AAC.3
MCILGPRDKSVPQNVSAATVLDFKGRNSKSLSDQPPGLPNYWKLPNLDRCMTWIQNDSKSLKITQFDAVDDLKWRFGDEK